MSNFLPVDNPESLICSSSAVQNRSLCEELLSAKTLQLSFKSLAELAELSSLQNRELLGIVPMSFFDQTSTSPR